MTISMAIIYGIIQGLTEFLPVSSSGHLALLPFFYSIKDPGLFFDLAMHVGTALSVAIYFHKDVKRIIYNSFALILPGRTCDDFTVNFIISTFLTGTLGLLLKPVAETYGRNSTFIAINLALFGIILFLADKFGKTDATMEKKNYKAAILIGVTQVLSIFPGVSRSGITITSGRFLGLSKENASSFSFLLSLPLIFAAFLLKLVGLLKSSEMIAFDAVQCFVGVVVSFVVGILTIHFFMKLIKKISFSWFMIYRIILAVSILYFSK